MTEHDPTNHDVDRFLRERIDTIPQLEALLLLWGSRPKPWSPKDVAAKLFVAADAAREILENLAEQRIIAAVSGADETYRYESDPDRDRLVASVDSTYRRELVRVTRLVHSKPRVRE